MRKKKSPEARVVVTVLGKTVKISGLESTFLTSLVLELDVRLFCHLLCPR